MKLVKGFIFLIIGLLFFNCNKGKKISVTDIKPPKYFSEYNYVKFWNKKGVDFTFLNKNNFEKGFYKDSQSTNFLSISEALPNILSLDLKTRIKLLKKEMNFQNYKVYPNFEIYQARYNEIFLNRPITSYQTLFLIKKDTVCISLNYFSFDNNLQKKKDYYKIVNVIKKRCAEGYTFISKRHK